MPVFQLRSPIDATPDDLFRWHSRPGAFERLTPPWQDVRVVEQTGGVRDGSTWTFELRRGPLKIRWIARLCDCEPPSQFRDEQVQGPFAAWVHTHRFLPADRGSILEDTVEYRLRGGALGAVLAGAFVDRTLGRMFRFRHARTQADLRRHRGFAGPAPLRVLVSGAGGLVGGALAAFLASGGHQVLRLVRRPARPESFEIQYDPARRIVDAVALEGLDAVVHLGGANIGEARWTPSRRTAIRESRIRSTRLLAEALARLRRPPRVFVCASAIGFYGDRGEAALTEESAPGAGFLADVCREWEAAAGPAAQAGIRTIQLRIGPVLSAQGGVLTRMLLPFRFGLGGRMGAGRQVVSWIALDDLVGAIHFCLMNDSLAGPVNAVAPAPVSNIEFAHTLARVLRRPALVPIPAPAIRALFGQMGQELLLAGARVVPAKLLAAGFRFLHPSLREALAAELGLPDGRAGR